MKRILWLLALLLLLTGCDDGLYSSTLVFEGEHFFTRDTHLPGDVFLRAGTVDLPAGSQIDGSLYMLGGALSANGEIGGDLFLLDGALTLGPRAVVGGDLRHAGGTVNIADSAHIAGETISSNGLAIPRDIWQRTRGVDDYLRALSAALLLAGLGALLYPNLSRPVNNVGQALRDYPLVAGAVGLLLVLVLPALLVMMIFTVILIPLVLIIGMLLLLLLGYGLVAVGYQLGQWLASLLPGRLDARLSPRTLTFWGTLLLLLSFEIPLLGDVLFLLTALWILGSLLITRLGLFHFTTAAVKAAADPAVYTRNVERT